MLFRLSLAASHSVLGSVVFSLGYFPFFFLFFFFVALYIDGIGWARVVWNQVFYFALPLFLCVFFLFRLGFSVLLGYIVRYGTCLHVDVFSGGGCERTSSKEERHWPCESGDARMLFYLLSAECGMIKVQSNLVSSKTSICQRDICQQYCQTTINGCFSLQRTSCNLERQVCIKIRVRWPARRGTSRPYKRSDALSGRVRVHECTAGAEKLPIVLVGVPVF